MKIYNAKEESDAIDEMSVFSFCADSKSQVDKKSCIASLITDSNSHHGLMFQSNYEKSGSCTLDSDEILSMFDFFVNAKDEDSQTERGISLLSNTGEGDSYRVMNIKAGRDVSAGIDLIELKKARNLMSLRYRKAIRKMSITAKAYFKRRIEFKNAIVDLDQVYGRLGNGETEDRFRDNRIK